MRQSLLSNGILLSDEELYALEERFNNEVGFNYFWFLKEVEPSSCEQRVNFVVVYLQFCTAIFISVLVPFTMKCVVKNI